MRFRIKDMRNLELDNEGRPKISAMPVGWRTDFEQSSIMMYLVAPERYAVQHGLIACFFDANKTLEERTEALLEAYKDFIQINIERRLASEESIAWAVPHAEDEIRDLFPT